MSSLRKLKRY